MTLRLAPVLVSRGVRGVGRPVRSNPGLMRLGQLALMHLQELWETSNHIGVLSRMLSSILMRDGVWQHCQEEFGAES